MGKLYPILSFFRKRRNSAEDIPIDVFIEMNNSCNLRCKMCNIDTMERKVENLSLEHCKKAIESAARMNIPIVRLHMYGEPLLNKQLINMIRYSKEQGIKIVHITTNATLLNDKLSAELIDAGLDSITFSVSGSSEEIYSRFQGYRSHYTLKDVENKIEEFIIIRKQKNKSTPEISMQYIFDGENLIDCIKFNKKWNQKVDYIKYTALTKWEGDETKEKLVQDVVSCIINSLAVLSNGDVTVCCSDFEGKLKLGNIKDQPLESYWKNDKFNRIQKILDSKNFDHLPIMCKNCIHIIDTVQWGTDFNDVLYRAALYSLMNAIFNNNRKIIIIGDGKISKALLQYERINERVIGVIGKKYGELKGKPVMKYKYMKELLDHNVMIINTTGKNNPKLPYYEDILILNYNEILNEIKKTAKNIETKLKCS